MVGLNLFNDFESNSERAATVFKRDNWFFAREDCM